MEFTFTVSSGNFNSRDINECISKLTPHHCATTYEWYQFVPTAAFVDRVPIFKRRIKNFPIVLPYRSRVHNRTDRIDEEQDSVSFMISVMIP